MYIAKRDSVRIDLFCCASSLDPAELSGANGTQGIDLRVIPLPCSGKADILYLTKSFETGADGVAVVTCKKGDCRYIEGNLRAQKRVQAVDELLEEIGLGRGRTVMIRLDERGVEQVKRELADFRTRIKASPRSAYSGDEQELDKE
jgi:coenzyme F420-reducing hydrogenase delta subunit